MAISVGTNSWVTIAEADVYLTNRLDAENWFLLTDEEDPGEASKTTYLVTAFYMLYNNTDFQIALDCSDVNVKNAQCEMALFLLNNYADFYRRMSLIASGVDDFTRSKWSETLGKIEIPYNIIGMLRFYGSAAGIATLKSPYDE